MTYPDSTTVTYTYNELGARTSMTDPSGNTSYTYDELNRLNSISQNGITFNYQLDTVGNVTSIHEYDLFWMTYSYNEINQMTSATSVPLSVLGTSLTLNISHDDNGRRTGEIMPNGVDVTYQYDLAGRLTNLQHQLGPTTIVESSYTLDNNGNRTSITNENNESTQYKYDKLNQLTKVQYPSGKSVDYIYDATGNRQQKCGEGEFEILLPGNATDYQYDYEDRLIYYQDGTITINYTYDMEQKYIVTSMPGVIC